MNSQSTTTPVPMTPSEKMMQGMNSQPAASQSPDSKNYFAKLAVTNAKKRAARVEQLRLLRANTHYKTARTINSGVLYIVALSTVAALVYYLLNEALDLALTSVVGGLVLLVFTGVATAIFDMADRVTSGE